MRSEILELLVNTWTANYEYSRSNRENLPLTIQMQLFEKPKIFCCIFIAFLESTLNFEHFEKKKNKNKNEPPSLSISEVIDSEPFGSERVKNCFFKILISCQLL